MLRGGRREEEEEDGEDGEEVLEEEEDAYEDEDEEEEEEGTTNIFARGSGSALVDHAEFLLAAEEERLRARAQLHSFSLTLKQQY